jgi:hypothetical protein
MAWFNRLWRQVKSYDIDEAAIGIGSNKVTIKPNVEDMQIAYKLWVELSTRKIGLEIDLGNDVIKEIYDSWYEFFSVTRELIKSIPVSKIRKDKSTKELVNLSIDVLNEGIRPHLTKWQARFRRWYSSEIDKADNCLLSPQDCQKKFPEYQELTKDLMAVNKRLIEYRNLLGKLAME